MSFRLVFKFSRQMINIKLHILTDIKLKMYKDERSTEKKDSSLSVLLSQSALVPKLYNMNNIHKIKLNSS